MLLRFIVANILAVTVLVSLLVTSSSIVNAAVPTDGSKNILLIVADDLGVDGISKYAEHNDAPNTSHIDDLANNGVFFRNTWTHPSCTPARSAIMTGRHGFRTGVSHTAGNYSKLPASEETIAEVLSNAGYNTGAFGKWGMGTDPDNLPYNQGFHYYAGSLKNSITHYYSWDKTIYENGNVTSVQNHPTYATIDTTTEALDWIEDTELNSSSPWFAYVAFNAPHGPWHIPPSATHSFNLTNCNGVARRNCYRAAIESMDYYIGEILDKLGAGSGNLDVLNDTLIIFISDNGTPNNQIIAEADATPFTSGHGKGTVYEGGLNVPMVIYGGLNLDVDAGIEVTDILYGMDIFQTIIDIANGIPASGNTLDSQSLLGYLDETPDPAERARVYSELYNGNQNVDSWAVFNGRRKFIHYFDGTNGVDECYNIRNDPGETNDKWANQSGNVYATCANQLKPNRECLGSAEGCPPSL